MLRRHRAARVGRQFDAEGTPSSCCAHGADPPRPWEVFRLSWRDPRRGEASRADSTDSGAIKAVEDAIDLNKTLFVVSTKFGGTIETLSLYNYFFAQTGDGRHFVAVTDAGSGLEANAKEQGLPHLLRRPEHRRALHGAHLLRARAGGAHGRRHRGRAQPRARGGAELRPLRVDGDQLLGLWLGLAMGELAREGRDKVTFFVSTRSRASRSGSSS